MPPADFGATDTYGTELLSFGFFDALQLQAAAIALFSFSLGCLLILLRTPFPRLAGRPHDLAAVQAAHQTATPRVGGIAIFGGLVLANFFVPASLASGYHRFVLAAGLLFSIGLLEDLGLHVSPRGRLLACCLASLVFILLTGVWIPRADIPILDAYVSHWAVGVPMTLLITAGAANAFNLIDGVNGLAGFTALLTSICLALIAHEGGYPEMTRLAILLASGILGFLILNFPFGLLFLGDAGAYTIGFVLSWFGISILLNVPDATAWAVLLTLFWPAADTALAIHRRLLRNAPSFHPDRMHVHQLVMRGLEIVWLGRNRRHISNPLTTVVLLPLVAAPSIAGVVLWDQPLAAFLAVLGFGGLFLFAYSRALSLLRRRAIRVRAARGD